MQLKTLGESLGVTKTINDILEITTAELAQVTSTNSLSASQEAATTTTMGFGNAVKGLGVSIKNLMSAHPILLAITDVISADIVTVTIKPNKINYQIQNIKLLGKLDILSPFIPAVFTMHRISDI